jgi:MYXO-CTERM domain-containing protein
VQACAFVSCLQGQRCNIDGFCVDDPCIGKEGTCGTQICQNGACVPDPCRGVDCGVQVCDGGVCVDDPCTGVVCPVGQCFKGQCTSKDNKEGLGTIPRAAAAGCGCGAGEATPLAALLLAALAPLARRRRRGSAVLALLLAGVALTAAGCSGTAKKVSEGPCTATCDGQCTDIGSDPANCGICGQACAAGSICVSGVCGSGGVAPFISRINPGSLPKGAIAPVPVDLYGERFASGATLRTSGASGAATLQTDFVDAGHLRASIDLEAASLGTAQLRIVNPNRVISNAVPVQVVVPSPLIDAIDPAVVTAGTNPDVKVSGSGLINSSTCWISSGGVVPPYAVSTTLGSDGSIHCAPGVLQQPGTYQLWIVNDGNLASKHMTLTVTSADPVITALDPTSADAGTTVALTVLGTGFDATSTVVFDGLDRTTSYLDPTRLFAQVDLGSCGSAPCAGGSSYGVTVRNGTGAGAKTSAPVMFTVGSSAAKIQSVSPQSAYLGQKPTITFTAAAGTLFPAGTVMEVSQPGGTFGSSIVQQTPPGGPVTSVSGQLDLTVTGEKEGQWAMRLAYPLGGGSFSYSEFYPLRVLSNGAVLSSSSPSGGPQGATLSLTLDGSNFFPGIVVHFRDSSGAVDKTPATSITGTAPQTLSVTGLSLANLDTGQYVLTAVNVGAPASNTLPFTITPGPPTVTSVSPTSAVQSSTPVPVTITGTNFAKPDGTGVNGSVVHASAPSLGVTDYVIPTSATTVVDPNTIKIVFDTRAAIKGTYSISVWNPGGVAPNYLQKSNSDKTFTVQ